MNESVSAQIGHAYGEWISAIDAFEAAIFMHDKDFRILRCNKAYQKYAGLPFKDIIGHPYFEIFPKSDTPLHSCLQAKEKPVAKGIEEEIEVGETLLRSLSYAITDKNGEYLYSVHILEDITQQRKTQMDLISSELRYRRLFEAAKDGILLLDVKTGKIVDANPFILDLISYTLDECLGKELWEIGFFSDAKESKKAFSELQKNGYIRYEDLPLKKKDGTQVDVEFVSNIYPLNGKKIIQCNIRDITERHLYEKSLQESELRFKAIFEGAHDGIVVADAVTKKLTQANARICKMLGYTKEEMLSLSVEEIHPAKDLPYVLSQFEKQAKGEIELAAELPVRRKDGSVFFVDVNSFAVVISGKNYLAGFFRDITERKEAEKAIQESEEKFRSITGSAQDAILMMDNDGKISYWNAAAEKILGYSEKEAIGQLLHKLIAPERFLEAHAIGFKHFQTTGEGPVVGKTVELVALKKDGMEMPIELSLSAVIRDGRWSAIGIIRDITDRKLSEQKIKDEKVFSESLIQSLPGIFFFLDQNASMIRWNKKLQELMGLSQDEMLGRNAMTFMHEDDRAYAIQNLQKAFEEGSASVEVRMLCINGIRYYAITGNRIETQHGTNVLGIGVDITERKQGELELQQERDFNSRLVDTAPLIVLMMDKEGKILRFNSYMERITGYASDEVKGKDWFDLFLPEADRETMKELFSQAINGIEIKGNINPVLKKDGTQVYIEWYNTTLKDAQGNTIGLLSMGVDITERIQSEAVIKRANRALKTLSAGNLALVRAKSENELLKEITRVIVENGEYSLAVVDYADKNHEKPITPVAWTGFEKRTHWVKELNWGDKEETELPVARAIRTGKTQIYHDITNNPSFKAWKEDALDHDYHSNIVLPLLENEKAFGALCIYSSEIESFDEDEVKLLEELASDLAYGIINLRRRLEQEQNTLLMQQSMEQSVQAIAATLESRDPYTAGHQRRVSELAIAIAREMNLPEDQIKGIHFAAIIHDLGKIHVPAEILSKPGRLNELEYQLIQMHPQSGYDIIKDVTFPWPIAQIILQHHEKIDGSGYPQGLKGDEILLEAKIISVADVVEAISSHRPYRPAMGMDIALEEVKRGRGSEYDPDVVDACIRVFDEKGFMFNVEAS